MFLRRELSCPLSLEMLAIFSSRPSNDAGVIDAECTSLSQSPSSNQYVIPRHLAKLTAGISRSLFAVTNVTQLEVMYVAIIYGSKLITVMAAVMRQRERKRFLALPKRWKLCTVELSCCPSSHSLPSPCRVLNSSLATPCDCIKRAAAAWSLGAILPSEYAYKCGADGHEDVVAASGTHVTTS